MAIFCVKIWKDKVFIKMGKSTTTTTAEATATVERPPQPVAENAHLIKEGYGFAQKEGVKVLVDNFMYIGGYNAKSKPFWQFNLYVEFEKPENSFIFNSLRMKDGKILPPYKFNMRTKKFWDSNHISAFTARLINEAVCTKFDRAAFGIESPDKTVRNLRCEDERFYKLFPSTLLKNEQLARREHLELVKEMEEAEVVAEVVK